MNCYIKTKNLSDLKANQYLNQLVKFISETYNYKRGVSVKLSVGTEIRQFDMNRTIPCGLNINELVSNAFKFAFEKTQKVRIHIELKVFKNKDYRNDCPFAIMALVFHYSLT
jgi:two-component sensor histidine kinase